MTAAVQTPVLPQMDEDGLLLDPNSWNEELANMMAQEMDIAPLTDEHWLVIYALRDYYKKFGVAPSMNTVCHRQGKDKHWVHNLFFTCLNAWRVAGLPNPGEEAKSYLSDM